MFRDRIFNEERFFRGSRRRSSFQKGDLKYIILDLIKDKPRHGYDIIRELEEQSYGLYKPSPGVIYPTLQMLEEMGYASSTEQEGKKVYSVTEDGLQFLAKQKEFFFMLLWDAITPKLGLVDISYATSMLITITLWLAVAPLAAVSGRKRR